MTLEAIIKVRGAARRARATVQRVRPLDWRPFMQQGGVTPCAAWDSGVPRCMGGAERAVWRLQVQSYWREAAREVYLPVTA